MKDVYLALAVPSLFVGSNIAKSLDLIGFPVFLLKQEIVV